MVSNARIITMAMMAIISFASVKAIMNGADTREGQFPHMVSLRCKSIRFHICGGAIINNWFIVSGAECMNKYVSNRDLVAHLGAWKVNAPNNIVKSVAEVRLHPGFHIGSKRHDISLIKMAEEIVFTELIKPIPLPTEDFPDEKRQMLFVSGFGALYPPSDLPESEDSAFMLQYDYVHTSTIEQCRKDFLKWPQKLFVGLNDLDEHFLCSEVSCVRGLCVGDEGSPLVNNGTLIGIASWSLQCTGRFPNVYIKVFPYLDWIKEQWRQ